MLQFQQPIWLWASAAIMVPVIIHLWNIKQGKTLKVGSIFLFTESAKSGVKTRKITDWLLLLLRCFLLIAFVLLMAKPYWIKPANPLEKGWLLIPENELAEAYKAYQPLIDSLLNKGYVLRDFDASFKEKNLKEALQKKPDSTHRSLASYWALLKEADENNSPQLPFFVFTDNMLKHFAGARPELSRAVKWYAVAGSDTASSWLQKAYITSADSLRIVTGNSHSFGTQYSYQNLSLHDPSQSYMTLTNHLYAGNADTDSTQPVAGVDTSLLHLVIYAKTKAADAGYVEAAVNAIRNFTQYKIKVTTCNSVTDIPAVCDWLFWLSEDTMPPILQAKHVLMYVQGFADNRTAELLVDSYSSLAATDPVLIYKRMQGIKDSPYQTIWQDALGNPVLSLEKSNPSVYHFYTRFNPQWSDLVWSSTFPQALYQLLVTKNKSDVTNDKRLIDTAQMQPVFAVNQRSINSRNQAEVEDLSQDFWLMIWLLFLAERILSFRTKNKEA